jgi:hypothetical protein
MNGFRLGWRAAGRYQVQAQVSCTTGDGWNSSQQVPTLCAPLATSPEDAARIIAYAATVMRDAQTAIVVHATVWDRETDAVETFKIEI